MTSFVIINNKLEIYCFLLNFHGGAQICFLISYARKNGLPSWDIGLIRPWKLNSNNSYDNETSFKIFVLQKWIFIFQINCIFVFASYDSTTLYPGQSTRRTGSPVQNISGLAGIEYFRSGRYRILRPASKEYRVRPVHYILLP